MHIKGPLVHGVFLRRPNRFLAVCQIDGKPIPCYLPNPGPMPDLLYPGVEILAQHSPGNNRKTSYDLIGVRHHGILLSLDSRVPNQLVYEALSSRILPPFSQYTQVRPEPLYEDSRLDFLLHGPGLPPCLVEVKSSTHAEEGIAYFPRAPTLRGQHHLHLLMHALDHGYRAAIIFIVQRTDATRFRPNDLIDPAFGDALRQAARHGVEAHAWTSSINEETGEIAIQSPIPVDLSPPLLI